MKIALETNGLRYDRISKTFPPVGAAPSRREPVPARPRHPGLGLALGLALLVLEWVGTQPSRPGRSRARTGKVAQIERCDTD